MAHNFGQLTGLVGPQQQIMAVVKADAYGHGAVPVAGLLERLCCHFFGVSTLAEAVELRSAGIARPILMLGGFSACECAELVRHDLRPVVFDLEMARALDEEARKAKRRLKFHLKLDTGMGRLGIPTSRVAGFLEGLRECTNLEMEGLLTHLAQADEEDKRFSQEQLVVFEKALPEINRLGFFPQLLHLANSAAILNFPPALKTLVRPGIMLYGISPTVGMQTKADLQPVMSLSSRIMFIKEVPPGTAIGYGGTFVTSRTSLIASVPVGYAHGYFRAFSNQAQALVRGQRAPVRGRVCMDWIMLDVTEIAGVSLRDEVVLLGRQGEQEVSSWELAGWADTIPYEIMCSIGTRSARIYVGSAEPLEYNLALTGYKGKGATWPQ